MESQGAFALRFGSEMKKRLNVPCELELANQTEFDEPVMRVNTDCINVQELGWKEEEAWDRLAEYYLSVNQSS